MNGGARLVGYLLVFSALTALLVAIPSAWATPEQSQPAQTVPTRTPKPAPPTSEPTNEPPETTPPTDIPTALPDTPAPTQSVTTPAAPVAAAVLVLKKQVAPAAVWPGATLHYTLTLSNRGTASAQQIVIQDTLPVDLIPGAIAPGPDTRWDGQTLQAQVPILPPGSQLVIAFSAEVRPNARPGGAISNQASATAAGNLQAVASVSVTLPPAELPPTGGLLDRILRTAAWGP